MDMQHLRMLFPLLLFPAASVCAQVPTNPKIDSLQALLSKAPQDTARVNLLINLAGQYAMVDPKSGIRSSWEAFQLSEKLDFKKGIADAYNKVGVNFQAQSMLDSSGHYFQKALAINQKIHNQKGIAQNLNNIALNYYFQSDFPKALDYMFRSLKVYEDLNDIDGMAAAYGNIGAVYQTRSKHQDALHYDTLALNKYIELGDKHNMALMFGNIGCAYESLKLTEQAIKYDLAAVKICEETGNKLGLARNLNNLSNLYLAKSDYAKTLDALQRALQLQIELDDQSDMALTYTNLGGLFLKRAVDSTNPAPIAGFPTDREACLRQSVAYLKEGIRISGDIGNLHTLSHSYNELADAYNHLKDYKSAFEAQRHYQKFSDSLFNVENNVRIADLETQRALAVKDKQLELDRLAVVKKRNERTFFISGIILLFGVAGMLFRNYRVQKGLNIELYDEQQKVEARTRELDKSNHELSDAMQELKDTQEQLIESEKQKENEIIRSRISQDIHDDISSELTRISWVSELAKSKASKNDFQELPVLLNKITHSSRETVSKLGEIIWTVNPRNDSLGSLLAYMHGHIAQFFADTPVEYSIEFPSAEMDISINPELKRNLFLVMKEALNNLLKYSEATKADVRFEMNENGYLMCIQDNGKGMEEGVVRGGGNGLLNMQKRMSDVQGTCEIQSRIGQGTKVCCRGTLY